MERSTTAIAASATAAAGIAAVLAWQRRRSSEPTLDEIGLRYMSKSAYKAGREAYQGGDKTSAGQGFTSSYEELLAPLRHASGVVLLEVGVWYGKSLAMFSDFLAPDATIHGVDISLARWNTHSAELRDMGAFRRGAVHVHQHDTSSDEFAAFASGLPPLDVVIDDGNHTAASQWQVFTLLFPRLRSGGTYIIEDIEEPSGLFSMLKLGSLVAAVSARPGVLWKCREVHEAREAAVVDAERLHAEALRKERAAVASLREKAAQLRAKVAASAAEKASATPKPQLETRASAASSSTASELSAVDARLHWIDATIGVAEAAGPTEEQSSRSSRRSSVGGNAAFWRDEAVAARAADDELHLAARLRWLGAAIGLTEQRDEAAGAVGAAPVAAAAAPPAPADAADAQVQNVSEWMKGLDSRTVADPAAFDSLLERAAAPATPQPLKRRPSVGGNPAFFRTPSVEAVEQAREPLAVEAAAKTPAAKTPAAEAPLPSPPDTVARRVEEAMAAAAADAAKRIADASKAAAAAAQQSETMEQALKQKEATLAAMPPTLGKAAKAAARASFDEALKTARALSELVETISVREMMVVVHRKGAREAV